MQLKRNESTAARRRVIFRCVDDSDNVTPETGLTFSAGDLKISKNGGAEANHAGSITEIGGGLYAYEFTAGELSTAGAITLRVAKSGVAPAAISAQVIERDLNDVNSLSLVDRTEIAKIVERVNAVTWYATPAGGGTGLIPSSPTTAAVAIAGSGAGDVVTLLAGTHEPATNLALAAGAILQGTGAGRSRLTRTTSDNNPVLSVGENSIVRDLQIDNTADENDQGQPCGSTASTPRLLYNVRFDRCVFRSNIDCFVLQSPGRHKVVFNDCDFDGTFDGFAGFACGMDVTFNRCRFFMRGANGRAIYIVDAGTNSIRIYLNDCVVVKRSPNNNTGGAIDVSGSDTEVRVVNTVVEGDDVGDVEALDINASGGAKVYVGESTVFDRARVSLATGATLRRGVALVPPASPPAADAHPDEALAWLLARSRNKTLVTDDAIQLLDDDDEVIAEIALTDDGTTLTQGKAEAPE